MPQPNLIHPIPVLVEPIDKGSTVYDDDAREEVQTVQYAAAVKLSGQVNSSVRTIAFAPTRAGPKESEDAYVLFRMLDLKAKGLITGDKPFGFAQGDRITSIGGAATKLYVIRAEPLGTYPPPLNFTLVKAFVESRDSARNA